MSTTTAISRGARRIRAVQLRCSIHWFSATRGNTGGYVKVTPGAVGFSVFEPHHTTWNTLRLSFQYAAFMILWYSCTPTREYCDDSWPSYEVHSCLNCFRCYICCIMALRVEMGVRSAIRQFHLRSYTVSRLGQQGCTVSPEWKRGQNSGVGT